MQGTTPKKFGNMTTANSSIIDFKEKIKSDVLNIRPNLISEQLINKEY